MRPLLAALAVPVGLCMLIAGWPGFDAIPAPDPIPLPAAAVATPVRFPAVPPIRSTPMFVSTDAPKIPLSAWHKRTLMHWYVPEPERYPPGAN